MHFTNFIPSLLLTAESADPAALDMTAGLTSFSYIIPMILLFVLAYFFMIRPQKKQEREQQEMRNNVRIGDEIVTVGGIIGLVCTIKDEYLVIETGPERNKIRIQRWAIGKINTVHESDTPSASANLKK